MKIKKDIINLKFKANQDYLTLTILTKIYPPEVIYQTCNLFLADYYVYLDGDPAKAITVSLKRKVAASKESVLVMEALAGEFYNELLNQLLRIKVSQSNAKIREYIVAQALYNALPKEVDELLQEVENENWQNDPLGIAKPWQDQEDVKSKKPAKPKK